MPTWLGTAIAILLLGGLGLLIFALTYILLKQVVFAQKSSQPTSKALRERDNDRVTLSQLQVALLAQAKGVQSDLCDLSLRIDTSTAEGLAELLQEAALVLLRHSEFWSHALSHSQSRHIDTAEAAFGQLSMAQRSKFSAETLTNVKGKVQQTALISPQNESSDYIVVTLLVGTAHDQPLFKTLRSTQELKEALEKLAAIPPDYLMKVEVLWSPQAETDSLTYDELLTEYTEMVPLI
jgi:uncharacterized membrane protein